jgi:hypothetical protein
VPHFLSSHFLVPEVPLALQRGPGGACVSGDWLIPCPPVCVNWRSLCNGLAAKQKGQTACLGLLASEGEGGGAAGRWKRQTPANRPASGAPNQGGVGWGGGRRRRSPRAGAGAGEKEMGTPLWLCGLLAAALNPGRLKSIGPSPATMAAGDDPIKTKTKRDKGQRGLAAAARAMFSIWISATCRCVPLRY